ncbi:MAG: ABC transporter ATP-binding protein [Treponema sp.]|nr:ABC transporter ATP-binding protein [Treponema sp.]
MNLFSCENITKNYNGEPVVQNISVDLPRGGFISLLGPSGAGKTTLFNVLSGVEKPECGRVILNGEDITGKTGKVSYMLQKDLLLEYRTVLDNVILALLIRGGKKKPSRQYARGFFELFGLSGYENKYPNELSGGMRQRAALLRTCLAAGRSDAAADLQPETAGGINNIPHNSVILLDEPFSALDAITRRKMQLWYADIASGMNISTLFITHDVDEALVLSDVVYILNGKPGMITRKIDVKPPRPRDASFAVSVEFARQKKLILDAIGV